MDAGFNFYRDDLIPVLNNKIYFGGMRGIPIIKLTPMNPQLIRYVILNDRADKSIVILDGC